MGVCRLLSNYGDRYIMTNKKKALYILITVIVFIVIAVLSVRGKYDWIIWDDDSKAGVMTIKQDREGIIELGRNIYNEEMGYYAVELNPIEAGDVTFTINSPGTSLDGESYDFTVLPLGIVMEKGKIGSIGNIEIIRMEILFIFILSGINIVFSLKRRIQENRYSYTIMYYMGALVFIVINILIFTFHVLENSLIDNKLSFVLNDIVNDASYFVFILFPLIVILAVFLAISNVVLIIKEGGGIRNLLGTGLGLFLMVFTIAMYFVDYIFGLGSRVAFLIDTVIYGLLAYFECVMIGTIIASVVTRRHVPKKNKDYMIILGCGLREDGTPLPLLQGRIDRALWFLKKQIKKSNKELKLVCSGGQGDDEIISEAQSMKNYLMSKGISEDKILLEDKSTSTYENMMFSKDVIDADMRGDDKKVAFSTTSYHVFRSGNIAHSIGLDAEGIGSKTKWYFYTNALIREFVANINSQKRQHVINALFILLICLMFSVLYFMI